MGLSLSKKIGILTLGYKRPSQETYVDCWTVLFFTGIAVSGLMLRLKVKELSTDPSFKASLGWYQNWKRRHSVSLRTKTTLAQRLPEDLEEKTVQFHRFIIAARRRTDYPLSWIYNMDEMPMRFELPSSWTLEFSGSRTVPVKSCEAEKRSFTVTLSWNWLGYKPNQKCLWWFSLCWRKKLFKTLGYKPNPPFRKKIPKTE